MPAELQAASPRANAGPLAVSEWLRYVSTVPIHWLLAGPAILCLLGVMLGPLLSVFVIATTDWQLGSPTLRFVGMSNFGALADDPTFWSALWNTVVYVALVVPLSVTGGLALAVTINARHALRSFYVAAHFLPVMATMAAMALSWDALLHPAIGLVNQTLRTFGVPQPNWLRDRELVLPVLAAIGIWQNLGYAMVLFLAGLRAIPRDLYDAAEIEGASGVLDRLITVTLPLLGSVTIFVVVVTAIRGFQVFDAVQILTQGGPEGSSEVLLHKLFVESFEFLHVGYGAAIAVVFLAILLTLTLVQTSIFDDRK